MVRYTLLPALIAMALILAKPLPLLAGEQPSERERAEEMALEAVKNMMRALELVIESIPQYELPEINDQGDIIIRRKRKPGRKTPAEPEVDETAT